MLLLLAGFWIIQTGLLSALDFTESKVEVQVEHERRHDADARSPRSARRSRRCPASPASTLVTREEALARFQQSMKDQGREDLSKYLDTNPFPPSYEIKLDRSELRGDRRGRAPADQQPGRPERARHEGDGQERQDRHRHHADRRAA